MQRIVEPELMETAEQARAYAAANFEQAHARYPVLFREKFPACPARGQALDLGCGPGDVTRRFAAALPGWEFDAVDGSAAMLAEAPPSERIRYFTGRMPALDLPRDRYDLVLSSSVLHHLHDPAVLWGTIRQYAGDLIFVVDLRRPASLAAARELTAAHTVGAPAVLRRDFYNSLLAAFTPAEVEAQLRAAGLTGVRVETISDRHLCAWGVR
jgi:trans-aconitate methyltransferase